MTKRYHGSSCKKCGKTLRLRTNRKCVACETLRESAPGRRDARRAYRVAKRATLQGFVKQMLYGARTRAKNKGLPFDLSAAPIEMRVSTGFCEATGLPFVISPHDGSTNTRPFAPTIDRIDNSKGYVWSNIRVVCNIYNTAKNDYSDSDVLRMVRAIAERQGWVAA